VNTSNSTPLLDLERISGCFFGGADGTWQRASHTVEVLEPATGEVLMHTATASPADVLSACQHARAAQILWRDMAPEERAAVFHRAADILERDAHEVARHIARESGSVLAKAHLEVVTAVKQLRVAAALPLQPVGLVLPSHGRDSYARRAPLGVIGVISPFNFPLVLSMRSVAPALALGNAVVLKPDPQTPFSGGFLIARVFEEAGLPSGLLQVLPGDAHAGAALVEAREVAMIAFTGSTSAGRKVGELAGRHLKKVSLELGGKNTLIVLDDVDLDVAASNAAFGSWFHQGQICMATGRIVAHRSIAAELTHRLVEKANRLPVGNPMKQGVAIGPIINARQLANIERIVQESVAAGATIEAGGRLDDRFYRPTVLSNVTPGMPAFDEEIFGPVAVVTSFETDEEAIGLANQTEFGLSCGVIGNDLARAKRIGKQLRCGMVHINEQTVGDEVVNPFGGRGHSGNGHSMGGPADHDEYTQWQWVTVKESAAHTSF
jgi:benzaldehyde dehydrogenase (NAD)